jgi:hypothetical protein
MSEPHIAPPSTNPMAAAPIPPVDGAVSTTNQQEEIKEVNKYASAPSSGGGARGEPAVQQHM